MKKSVRFFLFGLWLVNSCLMMSGRAEPFEHSESAALYDGYLERIKALRPDLFARLTFYEDYFKEPAFAITADPEPSILVPTKESHWFPRMMLTPELSDETLGNYLASYEALAPHAVPGYEPLPFAEYQQYLETLESIEPSVSEQIRTHLLEHGQPALLKASSPSEKKVIEPSFTTYGKPLIVVKALHELSDEEAQNLHPLMWQSVDAYHQAVQRLSQPTDTEALAFSHSRLPAEEYEQYMALIQQLNPSLYKRLRLYETVKPFNQALSFSPGSQSYVLLPGPKTNWKPEIVMGYDTATKPVEEQKKELAQLIETYNALTANLSQPFSIDEYENYTALIKLIDPVAYYELRECQDLLGTQCLRKGKRVITLKPMNASRGYPILIVPSLEGLPGEVDFLRSVVSGYRRTVMPAEKVVPLLKKLAPELVTRILQADPTADFYIRLDDRKGKGSKASVAFNRRTGLPIIRVASAFLELPEHEASLIIGHELGHYVLGHHHTGASTHKAFQNSTAYGFEENNSKEADADYSFSGMFKRAYTRINELEADRFSALLHGSAEALDTLRTLIQKEAQIEDAHEQARAKAQGKERKIEKETFLRSHPRSGSQRFAYLKELEHELTWRRETGRSQVAIDWDAIIQAHQTATP